LLVVVGGRMITPQEHDHHFAFCEEVVIQLAHAGLRHVYPPQSPSSKHVDFFPFLVAFIIATVFTSAIRSSVKKQVSS
jgi:hypothetical protein